MHGLANNVKGVVEKMDKSAKKAGKSNKKGQNERETGLWNLNE